LVLLEEAGIRLTPHRWAKAAVMITRTYSLSDIDKAFDAMARGDSAKRVITPPA
jgi:Zn-dependent alcohol dehydrogenase